MPFTTDQKRAIDARDKNVLVSASAGSGKTSVLVTRLCNLVLEENSIDSILAMTFTNDAAAEMKARLLKALQEENEKQPSDYLSNQMALLQTASICTIDSFCNSIVQKYYYKLGISYTMAKTVASASQTNAAFGKAYEDACNSLDPNQFARLKLYFQTYGKKEEDIAKLIKGFIDLANSKPDSVQWIQKIVDDSKKEPDDNIRYWFLFYFKERIQALIDLCDELVIIANKPEDFILKKQKLNDCLVYLKDNDYAGFRQAFRVYFESTLPIQGGKKSGLDDAVVKEFKNYEGEIARYLFSEDDFRKDREFVSEFVETYCALALDTSKRFSQYKKELEIIDYNDMEHFTYELLNMDDVREEVRNKYKFILVDEFQDTNDLQESIIGRIADLKDRKVFRVGDIKQSIYGFRQAKPDIMKGHMERKDEYSETIILKDNFRSGEGIVDFNNNFYEIIMNSELLGKNFTEDDRAVSGKKLTENEIQTEEKCAPIPVRFLYTAVDPWLKRQEEDIKKQTANRLHKENLPNLIAEDILKRVAAGRSYRDICILTRSHGPQEELKTALEAYGIPVMAEIGHGFYTNSAIQIMLNVLQAMVNPYDDISLCGALMSPILNVDTQTLADACRTKNRYENLYSHIKDEPWMKGWKEIQALVSRPIPEIIRSIFKINDFYELHTTSQDKTNLDLFLEIASNYTDPKDIRGFLVYINEEAKQDEVGEAARFGKNEDVVQIKTIHGSKGLQYTVVYLYSKHETRDFDASNPIMADALLGLCPAGVDPEFKIKRESMAHIAARTKKFHDDLSEEMRILYVATTRPVFELVIVDSIDSLSSYPSRFDARALLSKKSYTGWLLNTREDTGLVLDYIDSLSERPAAGSAFRTFAKKSYEKPVETLQSATASAAKVHLEWPPISFEKNMGTVRGTLFHEIAGGCSYPYQKEECASFAAKHGFAFTDNDFRKFEALNNNPEYHLWMASDHEFESSYIIEENGTITHGFMDLVAETNDKYVILDFKTDALDNPQDFIDRYAVQLQTYKEAMAKITDLPIETYIWSFRNNLLIPL